MISSRVRASSGRAREKVRVRWRELTAITALGRRQRVDLLRHVAAQIRLRQRARESEDADARAAMLHSQPRASSPGRARGLRGVWIRSDQ